MKKVPARAELFHVQGKAFERKLQSEYSPFATSRTKTGETAVFLVGLTKAKVLTITISNTRWCSP